LASAAFNGASSLASLLYLLVAVGRGGVLGDGVVVDDEQEHDEEADEALWGLVSGLCVGACLSVERLERKRELSLSLSTWLTLNAP
jgi:hypothetical protein